jgi:hypothetical protein
LSASRDAIFCVFKKSAERKPIVKTKIFFGLAIALIITFLVWMSEKVNVDRCLDHGGKWNYEEGDCQMHE